MASVCAPAPAMVLSQLDHQTPHILRILLYIGMCVYMYITENLLTGPASKFIELVWHGCNGISMTQKTGSEHIFVVDLWCSWLTGTVMD